MIADDVTNEKIQEIIKENKYKIEKIMQERIKEKEDEIFYTKKTITQDPEDPSVQWIELDIYNFLKDQETEDKTIH